MSEIDNSELAGMLEEFAQRLEALDVEYKPTAYRRAAEAVADQPQNVAAMIREDPDAVTAIDGVGDAIAAKLEAYVQTGTVEELEELRSELPVEIGALTAIDGVGPKTVGRLYDELGVQTVPELERAARDGEIRTVHGFGPKTEANIIENITFTKRAQRRELLGDTRPVADRLRDRLSALSETDQCGLAGSIRRWKPTVGDIDILVATTAPAAVVDVFLAAGDQTLEAGATKASIRLDGVQADLRVVDPDEYGSAQQYFTGSKAHNVALRQYALDQGVSLNEYGAYRVDADGEPTDRIAGETESSMYEALGLPWIPPELRQGTGEIEAAADGGLPRLLDQEAVRGDLHVHTAASDGGASITEMIEAAAAFGHDYIAITDHATGAGLPSGIGLEDDALATHRDRIERVAAEAPIEVFTGVETNIAADGGLTTADELLETLDLVVASPHAGLQGDGTDRLIAAMDHPAVDVLGHPSGRQINQRSGLDIDPAALGAAAAKTDTALEINSNPIRLDLWGEAVRAAVDAGARIAVNTDAHSPAEYEHLRYGVHTARRGWVSEADVLNARPAEAVV